jgi:hypothetical protein
MASTTILLVDDDEALLHTLAIVLQEHRLRHPFKWNYDNRRGGGFTTESGDGQLHGGVSSRSYPRLAG